MIWSVFMALLLEMRGISPDGDVSVIARLVTRHRPGPYPQVGEVLRRLRRWPLRLPVPPTTALGLVRCAAAGRICANRLKPLFDIWKLKDPVHLCV